MTPWGPQGSGAGRRKIQISRQTAIIAGRVGRPDRPDRQVPPDQQRPAHLLLRPDPVDHPPRDQPRGRGPGLRRHDGQAGRPAQPQPDPPRRSRWAPCWSPPSCRCPASVPTDGPSRCRSTRGNLRSPRNHVVLVSLVGPLTNFVLAALMGVCFVAVGGRSILVQGYFVAEPSLVQQIFIYAGLANIVLGAVQPDPVPAPRRCGHPGAAPAGPVPPRLLEPPAVPDVPAAHPHPALPQRLVVVDQPRVQLVVAPPGIVTGSRPGPSPHPLCPARVPVRGRGSVWGTVGRGVR